MGYFLPQVVTVAHSERLAARRPFLPKVSVMELVPTLFIALTCLLRPSAAGVAFAVLAVCLAMATLSSGLGGPLEHQLANGDPRRAARFFFG